MGSVKKVYKEQLLEYEKYCAARNKSQAGKSSHSGGPVGAPLDKFKVLVQSALPPPVCKHTAQSSHPAVSKKQKTEPQVKFQLLQLFPVI